MASSKARTLVRQWRDRFREDPLAAAVVAGLSGRGDEIWQKAFERLQRESAEYRNSVDDEFTKESKSHCNELLRTIIAVAAGRAEKSGGDTFEFVRVHAVWRARHQVPLIASLHAYRLAHKIYWGSTRESLARNAKEDESLRSLSMLSDFWIEFFDHVGMVLAEAHAAEEGLIVAQRTRTYVSLIDGLLRGYTPMDAESRRICALCGLKAGAPMVVAVARPLHSGNARQVDPEVTLRSLVRLIEQALPLASFGQPIDIRDGDVIPLVCSEADTADGMVLALRRNGVEKRAANGRAAGVGIGFERREFSGIPESLGEARQALDFASPSKPLMLFRDIDLPEYLLRHAAAAALRLIPRWAHQLAGSEDDHARQLVRTIHAFAARSFNVKQTARRLGVHTNTVYFRLNRISELTGLDPRTYSGTASLLTALRLMEVHGRPGESA